MSTEEAWKKHTAEQIAALAAPATGTTKAARFRALFPELEAAMARGVSQSALIAALADAGLAMTLDELRNALYRERKRLNRARATHEAPTPKPPAAPPAPIALPADSPAPAGRFDWQAHRNTKPTF